MVKQKKKWTVSIQSKENEEVKDSFVVDAYSKKQAESLAIILNGENYWITNVRPFVLKVMSSIRKINGKNVKVSGYVRSAPRVKKLHKKDRSSDDIAMELYGKKYSQLDPVNKSNVIHYINLIGRR